MKQSSTSARNIHVATFHCTGAMSTVRPCWSREDALSGRYRRQEYFLGLPARQAISGVVEDPLRANCEVVVYGFVPGAGGAAGGLGSLILGAHDYSSDRSSVSEDGGTSLTHRQRREARTSVIKRELSVRLSLVAAGE